MIQIEREGEIGQDVRRKVRRGAREVGREVMGERREEGGTARHCHRLQTLHKENLRCASTQILDTAVRNSAVTTVRLVSFYQLRISNTHSGGTALPC